MKKRKCPYCEQELNGGSRHIFYCGEKLYPNKSKEEIKKEFIEFNFPNISNKKNLKLEYHKNLKSLPDLKKEFGIDFKSVIFLLDYYNIPKRNISQSAKKISYKKYVKTCRDKYGVDNVSQLQSIKNKKSETFTEHYGVDNVRKSDEFKSWLKNYMKNTYGIGSLPDINGNADSWGWNKLSLEDKQERLKKLHSNFESGIEKEIQGILSDLNIPYSTQFFIANRSFDIKIGKSKKIIEVNGDYWHANPEIYKKGDIICNKHLGNITAEEIWKKDLQKKELAESKGYKVLYIWENDIKIKSRQEMEIVLLDFLLED